MNTIALVGNPNSGKSSLFNQLTGMRQKVANFPGVTVDKKSAKLLLPDNEEVVLVDFPGAYSLYPSSDDERVVLNVLANPDDENYPDAVVYVADVTNLEKHLLLLTQIKDLGLPCLLALNMSDIAEEEGIRVDERRLSKLLQVPVVSVSGRQGTNIGALKEGIQQMLGKPNGTHPFYQPTAKENQAVQLLSDQLGTDNPYRALLWAHHFKRLPFFKPEDRETVARINAFAGFDDIHLQISETLRRFDLFTPILHETIKKAPSKITLTDRLDNVFTHSLMAPVLFFGIMLLVFQAVFAWAEYPMNWIEAGIGWLGEGIKGSLPPGWATDLLTEGVLTGIGGILVFVPQIAILFFLITLLEEVGYMARAVYIFDKPMQQFGLNGRSVVSLVSGGACAIPAIMSARTIGNWKERLITILVTPMISCSARIPVYTVLIGFVVPRQQVLGLLNLQGIAFMGLYLLGIVGALGSAWLFKTILRTGEPSWLMLQLPSYRLPSWRNVWQTVLEKVTSFVVEAGKIIMVMSIVLWFLATYGPTEKMAAAEQAAATQAQARGLSPQAADDLKASLKIEASYAGHLGKAIEPAIRPLGFDWKIGIALVTSFAAREVFVATMATIYSIGSTDDEATIHERLSEARHPDSGLKVYTPATALSLLVFYVFAMQCMSTIAVVRRETGGWKWPLVQFGYMSALAYLGSLLAFQWLS